MTWGDIAALAVYLGGVGVFLLAIDRMIKNRDRLVTKLLNDGDLEGEDSDE